jgi:hypothetical protein
MLEPFIKERQDVSAVLELYNDLDQISVFINTSPFSISLLLPLLILVNNCSTPFYPTSFITSSPLTLGIGVGIKHNIWAESGLMSRALHQTHPQETDNCMRISHYIYASKDVRPTKIGEGYTSIRNTKNIIFDIYQEENVFLRTKKLKNRHFLVIKVAVEYLNLSLETCGPIQYKENENTTFPRTLDFGISSYKQRLEKKGRSDLIFSREQYRLKFASTDKLDHLSKALSLLKPIG